MTECPSAMVLLAFALGTGDESQAPAIGRHVETCADCAGFVADVSDFPDDIEPREGAAPVTDAQLEVDRDALRLTNGHHLTLKLLGAYCDGDLATTSEELVMDHLATCRTCARMMLKLTDRSNPEPSWTAFLEKHGEDLDLGDEAD